MASAANLDIDAVASGDGHSYFIPMVDMLAGVVFILVILLAAATLVSRDEFVKAETSQTQSAKAQADLQAAQKMEAQAQEIVKQTQRLYLDPRRQMEIATKTLLDRLSDALTRQGYQVETNIAEGRLNIAGSQAFTGDEIQLSAKGQQLSRDIAAALRQELPCLTTRPAGLEQCALYPPVKLETAEIQVIDAAVAGRAPDAARADGRSLVLMSAIVGGQPDLVALRSPSGTGILSYAGDINADATAAGETVALKFQMAVPASKNRTTVPPPAKK